MTLLEKIINFQLSRQAKEAIKQEKENLFRLVGSYQGLSLALISHQT